MLQIVVWGLAGLLAVISTLPMFIVRSGGAATGGRVWAITVLACGAGFALFLFYAAADQAGAFSQSYDAAPISPGGLSNPFITQ